MAVGYEKLNTSAARSRRSAKKEIPKEQIPVVKRGTKIWDATYGFGETMSEFVSNCDSVKCKFESGYVVTMRGGAVRCGIAGREKKNV